MRVVLQRPESLGEVLVLVPAKCVTLRKLFNLSKPQGLYMQTKDIFLLKGRRLDLCFPEASPDIKFCIRM